MFRPDRDLGTPPPLHLALTTDILGCQDLEGASRDAATHPTVPRTPPPQRIVPPRMSLVPGVEKASPSPALR